VKAAEQRANLLARRAWSRVHGAEEARQRTKAIAAARTDIGQARAALQALVAVAPTLEREGLLGSACKRLALVERAAGDTAAEARALADMAHHYGRAEALALQQGHTGLFYPALNLLAADWLRGEALDAARVQRTRESLQRKRLDDPDFWSVAGLPELAVIEALHAGTLATALPDIEATLADLHARAGSAWLWASLADQLGFMLGGARVARAADRAAAAQLLARLQGHATAGSVPSP
jgi:hypothetical protein